MVFKLHFPFPFPYSVAFQFENDVKMYGIQTDRGWLGDRAAFENDVKMYGIQTDLLLELR